MTQPSLFSISPEVAAGYTKAWRDQPHEEENYAKAFTVKLQELEDIIAEVKLVQNMNAVRMYIGKKLNDQNVLVETILLVGVQGFDPSIKEAGIDVIEYSDPNDPTGTKLSGIYDFNYPCPATCAKNSPLLDEKYLGIRKVLL